MELEHIFVVVVVCESVKLSPTEFPDQEKTYSEISAADSCLERAWVRPLFLSSCWERMKWPQQGTGMIAQESKHCPGTLEISAQYQSGWNFGSKISISPGGQDKSDKILDWKAWAEFCMWVQSDDVLCFLLKRQLKESTRCPFFGDILLKPGRGNSQPREVCNVQDMDRVWGKHWGKKTAQDGVSQPG